MEFFDIVDEKGIPTGESIERTQAHKKGVRHRTAHIWIVREQNGKAQLLLQKRSAEKRQLSGAVRYFFRRTYSGGGRAGGICNTGTSRRTGNPGI